jgi:hypothetical protein
MWFYDKAKRLDDKGGRRHFVTRHLTGENGSSVNRPFELYFRNDAPTEFGLLRFERREDNPYRNYEVMVNKIMNNDEFRKTLLDSQTKDLRSRNRK